MSLFSNKRPKNASSVDPGKGGIAGEVGDLRRDVADTFAAIGGYVTEEFINPLATAANNMMTATASQLAARTLLPGSPAAGVLSTATVANLAAAPRQIQFTTAGSTPAHQPATATIYGKDERGKPQTEVVPLKQEAGLFLSAFFYSDVDKVELSAGQGTGATLAIGLGAKIGLKQKVLSRAGRVAVIQEVAAGSVVTNGVVATAATGTAAAATGTANIVDPTPTLPTTETLILAVDGAAPITTTFATPADAAAVVDAINTAVGVTVAALGGVGSKFLVLTSPTTGVGSSLVISGTALTILGLTAGTVRGVGNGRFGSYTPNATLDGSVDFALTYEFDGAAA